MSLFCPHTVAYYVSSPYYATGMLIYQSLLSQVCTEVCTMLQTNTHAPPPPVVATDLESPRNPKHGISEQYTFVQVKLRTFA